MADAIFITGVLINTRQIGHAKLLVLYLSLVSLMLLSLILGLGKKLDSFYLLHTLESLFVDKLVLSSSLV